MEQTIPSLSPSPKFAVANMVMIVVMTVLVIATALDSAIAGLDVLQDSSPSLSASNLSTAQ